MEMFLEQSVKFEEGSRICGVYVVNSQDPQYLSELAESETEVGHVEFDYDVKTNQLSFKAVGCEKFAAANYRQLVETVWSKIRMIQAYWRSPEYLVRRKLAERKDEVLKRYEKRKK